MTKFFAISENDMNVLTAMVSNLPAGVALVENIQRSTESVDIRSIFTFEQLSESVQAIVIDRNRYTNVDYDAWDDCIIESAKEELKKAGFGDCEVNYTGFYSQGDGASFTTEGIDLEQYMRNAKIWSKFKGLHRAIKESDLTMCVKRFNHRYYHEKSVDVEYNSWRLSTKESELAEKLCNIIGDDIEKRSKAIYKSLSESYELLTSDSEVKETLLNQDTEYTIDGKVI